MVINAGFIPCVEDFSPLGSVVAEEFSARSSYDRNVMGAFLAAVWNSKIKMAQMMIA